VALLLVFLQFRPSDCSPLAALSLATLSVLVTSQLIHMNSTMVSYLLLGVMLLLLRRGGMLGELADDEEPAPRALWGLPLVFLLWVNLDAWFIIGLLTLVLVVLGNAVGAILGWKSRCPAPAQAVALLT